MNIQNVADTIRELSGETSYKIITFLHSEYYRGQLYGGINDHTTLSALMFKRVWNYSNKNHEYRLSVGLTHKCPISTFDSKIIRKAPYYCKNCTQCIISADQGDGFLLPVDLKIVPKMQIGVAHSAFKGDPSKDFDIGSMVLTEYDGWIHKCPEIKRITKQTITASPFKCKFCKKVIGEEGFDFKKMVAVAALMMPKAEK